MTGFATLRLRVLELTLSDPCGAAARGCLSLNERDDQARRECIGRFRSAARGSGDATGALKKLQEAAVRYPRRDLFPAVFGR